MDYRKNDLLCSQICRKQKSTFFPLEQLKTIFKACVRYFLSFYSLSPNDSPSKNMKNVYFI